MSKSAKSAANANGDTLLANSLSFIQLGRILDYETENASMGNRKIDKQWVKELAADISRNGLTVPLLVWNGGSDAGKTAELPSGKEVPASFLVAGFHRRQAIQTIRDTEPARYKELFPNGIPCYVRGGTLAECITAQLRENVSRKGVESADILPQMLRLRDEFSMSSKDIAKAIGKSASYVSQVFAIEEELGEEGVEAVSKGEVKLQHAKDASREVKKAKAKGETPNVKEKVAKLKDKAKKLKDSGKEREVRRLSAGAILDRYEAIPASAKLKVGGRLLILEAALAYLAKREGVELPEELAVEDEKPAKGKKAKGDDEESEEEEA
jgi:ParB-like chromosome segregation protein Spo0J